MKSQVAELTKAGATSLIVDVRRTSGGSLDAGLAVARLFVASGTLAMRETKGSERETIAAKSGDGAITLPTNLLVDTGTSSAAEIVCVGAARQQAGRSHWRTHDRTRGIAAT